MASTIAAITTGIGGIVQTADASGNLSLLSGTTTIVAVTADGATVTGTLSASGAVAGTSGTFTGAVSGTTGTFTGATVTGALTTTGNTILGDASTDTLNVGNGGLVKDASGNVGIGTATASNRLTVGESGGPTQRFIDTTSGVFSNIQVGSNGDFTISADHGNTGASTNILFKSDGATERMRIDSSGNVGIGNVAPTQKLDVTGDATVSGTVTSTGLVTSGVKAHNGMYEASIRWSNDSPNAKTYKIAKFSSAYWGSGAYTIEVWKTYFDNFGYAKYIISGHTFTAYGPAMSLVTVSTTGTVTPVSLSGIIAIDAQGGYVNLIVTNPSYGQGRIKITSPANRIQTTNANISHNECYIYPENTVN